MLSAPRFLTSAASWCGRFTLFQLLSSVQLFPSRILLHRSPGSSGVCQPRSAGKTGTPSLTDAHHRDPRCASKPPAGGWGISRWSTARGHVQGSKPHGDQEPPKSRDVIPGASELWKRCPAHTAVKPLEVNAQPHGPPPGERTEALLQPLPSSYPLRMRQPSPPEAQVTWLPGAPNQYWLPQHSMPHATNGR